MLEEISLKKIEIETHHTSRGKNASPTKYFKYPLS